MDKYIISGGLRLAGSVRVQTAKNAVLPIFAAAVLTDAPVTALTVPDITDVRNMVKVLVWRG